MKNFIFNFRTFVAGMVLMPVLLLTLTTCLKVEPEQRVIIHTLGVSDVGNTSCTASGEVYDSGEGGMSEHGFCWATTPDPTVNSSGIVDLGSKSSLGVFTTTITGLTTNTKFYIRAYGKDGTGVQYGAQKDFTTTSGPLPPSITTSTLSGITQTAAQGGGNVTSDGGAAITSRGVCWGTSQNPTVSNSKTTDGTGTGSFDSNLTGLDCGTIYYVRAYATNSEGISYGDQTSFETLGCTADKPTVTTSTITGITQTSALGGGNVTNDGGASVTARGVCWSTSQSPTISDSHTTDGSGTGTYSSSIIDLSCGTTYYIRAYASNGSGTSYGTQQSFQTSECTTSDPPTVSSTTGVTNITQTSCQSGGTVSADGGAPVTAKGVCWSRSQNPTISDSKTSDGTGTGSFISVITGLDCNTAYYARAYATNSSGTSYGPQVSFSTLQCTVVPPTITTTTISGITETSAQGGGNVTSEGGTSVTAKGVCWSTSQNPTISGNKTNDGSGAGSYISTITGLSCNNTYYVRAYATTAEGTVYGSQVSFSTLSCGEPPTVTTGEISDIGVSWAIGGGNVTNNGGSTVTSRGVCWSTSQNPTISNSKTTDGGGNGSYSSNMTGLSNYVVYYVKAYATNSAGTSYGNQVSFRSSSVTDYDGNIYRITDVGSQTWMAENLKVTHFPDGSSIPFVTSDAAWFGLVNVAVAYSWFDNNTTYRDSRGGLYTWMAAVNSAGASDANPSGVQGACPAGYHLPSDSEWGQMEMYLGLTVSEAGATDWRGSDEGGKLKETGTAHFISPNIGATDAYGFTAIPGGYRSFSDGESKDINYIAAWWSSEIYGTNGRAWVRYINSDHSQIGRDHFYRNNGYSIRCVKD